MAEAAVTADVAGGLTSFEDARRLVLERASWIGFEQVDLADALGRVLADDVESQAPVPAFDNSAMDGYAVRAADTGPGDGAARLQVVDESRAGHPAERQLGEGEAIAISTGAKLPAGADAVVRIEDTETADGEVVVTVPVPTGNNVRHAGDDIAAGVRVIAAGTTIGPAELGVLGSLAIDPVLCAKRPRVAIVVTGDELVGSDDVLEPGQIHDANAHSLRALAERAGAEVVSVVGVGDDPEATRATLDAAISRADLLIASGGISVGPHDHVRPALLELGVAEVFWRIALKPGKPTWFGVRESDRRLAFGLPGNPVSAMVCFELLVRPAIRAMLGADPAAQRVVVRLDDDCEREPARLHAVRCRLEARADGWRAHTTGGQASHILTSMLGADGLALIPPGEGPLAAGSEVEMELLPRA